MAGAFQHLSHGVTVMFNVQTLETHQWQDRQQYFMEYPTMPRFQDFPNGRTLSKEMCRELVCAHPNSEGRENSLSV